MGNSFLHVGITFASGLPRTTGLEAWVQAAGDDWVRYSSNNWITWTNKTPQQVAETLRGGLEPADLILVARIDTFDCSGYLPQWIWDWINQPRPPGWRPPPPLPQLPRPPGPRRLGQPSTDPLAGLSELEKAFRDIDKR